MLPHQERVVAEKAALDIKLTDLEAFLARDDAESIAGSEELARLQHQALVMNSYTTILNERIEAFK
jgi:hypothetical protein